MRDMEMQQQHFGEHGMPMNDGHRFVSIRRSQLLFDGFDRLNSLGEGLKGRVRVQFLNEHGVPEAGVVGWVWERKGEEGETSQVDCQEVAGEGELVWLKVQSHSWITQDPAPPCPAASRPRPEPASSPPPPPHPPPSITPRMAEVSSRTSWSN